MTKAKMGDMVKVHYTGKLDNGKVFGSSNDKEPFEVSLGSEKVISGFEKSIVGMEVGEKKTVQIQPEDAFGPRRGELVAEVNKEQFPDDVQIKVGQQIKTPQPNGDSLVLTITDVQENKVTLDANHPLAGKTLTFDLELVEIVAA